MNFSKVTKPNVQSFSVWTLIVITISLFANASQTYAQCDDATYVNALKSHYGEISSKKVGEALYQASCKSRGRTGTTSLDVTSPQYGNLAYGNSSSSTSAACYTQNYTFFEENKRDITASALPPEAFNLLSNCFGGHTLRIARDGRMLNILAAYRSQDGSGLLDVVDSFTIKPEAAVKCDSSEVFKTGDPLKPGGRQFSCEILNDNEDITIILNAGKGSKKAVLKREPRVEVVRYKWTAERLGPARLYNCFNNGVKFGVTNTIFPTMLVDEVADPRLLAGSCLVLNGVGAVSIDDGEPTTIRDQWGVTREGITRNANVMFHCTLNGKVIDGPPLDCRTNNTCRNDSHRAYQCAGQYGLNY